MVAAIFGYRQPVPPQLDARDRTLLPDAPQRLGPLAAQPREAIPGPWTEQPRRAPPRGRAAAFLRLARPRQWPKNVLVFAAPAAAGALFVPAVLAQAALAALAFCLAASATYYLNDSIDADSDRRHERKRLRPVAAGLVTPRAAVLASVAMFTLAIWGPLLLGADQLAAVIGTYVVCQLAYSLRLKHFPVVEMLLVASGFVLRFVAGGVATGIPLSSWFVTVTLFASLLIVAGKRLSEHVGLRDHRGSHRAVLDRYSLRFLRGVATASAGIAILAYCGWVVHAANTPGAAALYLATVPPFVAGIGTFLGLAHAATADAPEELLYGQRSMQLIAAAWVATFMLAVYGG